MSKIDYYNLPLNDPETYNTLKQGYTTGIFQLESNLGRHFTKQLQPENIEHLSALGAILRPGVLDNVIQVDNKNKSITQSYCDRKNNKEPIVDLIPTCVDILEPTYGHMIYQEQLIAIASRLAGLSLEEADKFRKAVGLKQVDLMNEAEAMFLDGCKKVGLVSESEAKDIFEMMRKSQRYLFNKCLTPDTLVETKTGYETLDNVTIGTKIKAPSDDFNGQEYVEIIEKYDTGEQEVYEIFLASGKTIKCTLEHKFLCEDNEIRPLIDIFNLNFKLKNECLMTLQLLGKLPTINITVNNKHHLYYANGIITSNSHSLAYSIITYWSAFCKTHHPLEFFCSYLEYAKEKMDPQEEIKNLIQEMKLYNISLRVPYLPEIIESNDLGFQIKNNIILFGLNSIKGIGSSQVTKLINEIKSLNKDINEVNWADLLFHTNINKTVLTNLISVGVLDYLKIPRKQMLYEYNIFHQLSPREQKTIKGYNNLLIGLESIVTLPKALGGAFNSHRQEMLTSLLTSLKRPPYSLTDDLRWVFEQEKHLLGCNITCSKLDFRDNTYGDTKCIDFINKKFGNMTICVEILTIKEYIIKKGKDAGKPMAFITVCDETGKIDCCIFAEKLEQYKNLLYENNTIIINGYRSKKDSFNIEQIRDL